MNSQTEKYIIGLGNPGDKYKHSRHNIGFLLIQKFSKKYNSEFKLKSKLKSYYSEFKHENCIYRLFMPNTFMNNSGDCIKAITQWYKIEDANLIIIVDDIDIPFGKIRFRKKGGSGGHNGLKSIIRSLGSENFRRIRVGIGSPPFIESEKKRNTISHVLGNLSKQEKLHLEDLFEKIIVSLEKLDSKNEESIICELNSLKC